MGGTPTGAAGRALLWFGGSSLHPALIARLVRYGSGFNPLGPADEDLARLAAALTAAGRDPGDLEYVGGTRGLFSGPDGVADLDRALAGIPAQLARGFTTICVKPSQFVDQQPRSARSAASWWPRSPRSGVRRVLTGDRLLPYDPGKTREAPMAKSHPIRAPGRQVLSLPDVIAQSVGFMGPVFASAFVIPLVVGVISASGKGGGVAAPLSVLIAAVGVFAIGWIVARYAKEIHAAGSLYDYVTRGLGERIGTAAGWLYYAGVTVLMTWLLLIIGGYLQSTIQSEFSVNPLPAWPGR